jgi:flagellar basal-body rod protein FlgG
MKANQLFIDNISNNLSNVNTAAFKKNKMEFQDLLYQTLQEPGAGNGQGAAAPAGLQVGLGVRSASNQKIFSQGSLQETKNPYDMAITGSGFFQVAMPDGTISYTRDGSFKVASDGTLVTSSGFAIEPPIVLPEGTQADTFEVDGNGRVTIKITGSDVAEEIGQMELARFLNEGGLASLGKNLYGPTDSSGQAEIDFPGQNGLGFVEQGTLEASNVELVEEMVSMIVAQRAYEISSKAIQTSDSMMQMANQLKG